MAKIYTKKDKRIRIDWKRVLFDIYDGELHRRFYSFKFTHPKLSDNRCAFYVIKRSYSTTSLDRFVERVHTNFGRANPNWFFTPLEWSFKDVDI